MEQITLKGRYEDDNKMCIFCYSARLIGPDIVHSKLIYYCKPS